MEKNNLPLVTVFTLVYNTGKYVIEALESVRNNNYPNIQHIIIDDCSPDGTSPKMVEDWIRANQYHCQFIKHEVNKGVCKSLNEILTLARGKYIFGVSDDLIMPDKIHRQVRLLEEAPAHVGLCYSDVFLIEDNGTQLPQTYFESVNRSFEDYPEGNCLKEIVDSNFIPANSVMIKTECFQTVGHYDESLYYEDWDMNIRILSRFNIIKDHYINAKYRVHSNSMMQTRSYKYFDTTLQVEFKNLGVNSEIDETLKTRMKDDVEYYYASNGPRNVYWLWRVFNVTYSPKILFFTLMALIGLRHQFLMKMFGKR